MGGPDPFPIHGYKATFYGKSKTQILFTGNITGK